MAKEPRPKPVLKKAYRPAKVEPKKQPPVRERPLTEVGKALIDQMVWNGLQRIDAAKAVGITPDYAYRLLKSPEVMQIYQRELAALRESAKARAFHRLELLAQQDDNQTAAVAAVKIILAHGEEKSTGLTVNLNVTPGYVIDPTRAFARRQGMIAHQDDDVLTIDQVSDDRSVPPSDRAAVPETGAEMRQPAKPAVAAERAEPSKGPTFWRGPAKREGAE